MAYSGNFYQHIGNSVPDTHRFRFRKRYVLALAGMLAVAITPVTAALHTRPPADTPRQATSSAVTTQPSSTPSQSSSTNVEANVQGTATDAQVIINGHSVPVPDNGRLRRTVPGDDGQTDVNIHIQNQQSANEQTSSSTQIEIHSQSSSTDNDDEVSRHPPRR